MHAGCSGQADRIPSPSSRNANPAYRPWPASPPGPVDACHRPRAFRSNRGPLAERLDRFRGSTWMLGPVVAWQHEHGDSTFTVSARWLHELGVENRLAGNPLMVSGSITS